MKRKLISTVGALAAIVTLTAIGSVVLSPSMSGARTQLATNQTVAAKTATFTVENMTCALCPVTVKKAMAGVHGVSSVTVDFEAKTATVVFDPSVASAESIAAASTGAGYPAAPKS